MKNLQPKVPAVRQEESLEELIAKARKLREESKKLHERRRETAAEEQVRRTRELEDKEQSTRMKAEATRKETEARRNLRETREKLFKTKVENIRERIQPPPAVKEAFEIANKGTEIAVGTAARSTRSAAKATGKGLVKTGKFLRAWSESMPEVRGPTPTGILPSKTYVLIGKDHYDPMYKDLEEVFEDRAFTMQQATETLTAMGWSKQAAQAKVSSFINGGSMISEPIVPRVERVEIIPKVEIPQTKSMNTEIFGVDKQYF